MIGVPQGSTARHSQKKCCLLIPLLVLSSELKLGVYFAFHWFFFSPSVCYLYNSSKVSKRELILVLNWVQICITASAEPLPSAQRDRPHSPLQIPFLHSGLSSITNLLSAISSIVQKQNQENGEYDLLRLTFLKHYKAFESTHVIVTIKEVLYFVLLGSSPWYTCTMIHIASIIEMGEIALFWILYEHMLDFFHSSLYTFFSCLIAQAITSNTMLNSNGNTEDSHFIFNHMEKASWLSPLKYQLQGFCWYLYYVVEIFLKFHLSESYQKSVSFFQVSFLLQLI